MFSDGFGDISREELDFYEETIRAKERLIKLQAAERQNEPNDWEDLLNEARITVWEVLRKRPDAPPAYIHASTGYRITEVVQRGVWFGMEGHRGRVTDPIRRKDRDTLDDPDAPIVVAAADYIESIMLAYHEGEIVQALNALSPKHREYVVLRFWGGYSNVEIAALQGVRAKNMSRTWLEAIRPKLQEALGHLVDA